MEAVNVSTLDEISTQSGPEDRIRIAPAHSFWAGGLVSGLVWLAGAAVTTLLPDGSDIVDWSYTNHMAGLEAGLGAILLALALGGRLTAPATAKVRGATAWVVALGLTLTAWEIVTAKLALLPLPFFAPPQALLEAYLDDWPRLLECAWRSSLLLGTGYLIGAAAGFSTGIAIGWSKAAAYWGHPILRLLGPLPPTAWLPIALFLFPSSWSASIFLIALATAIPVAILTWSGVSSVPSAYYDVARTLGAKERFLVLKVAIPAALPHVFVGLFMGMSSSFVVLVVAEMLGVKAGLGWYLSWAQGWAAYSNMYAALLIMALLCSGLVTLLFAVRNKVLSWQKGLVRW